MLSDKYEFADHMQAVSQRNNTTFLENCAIYTLKRTGTQMLIMYGIAQRKFTTQTWVMG